MLVTMADKELYRLGIIQRVFDRALLQRDAADILELSVRQVQRLVRLYRTDGASAFASSRRRTRVYQPRYRRDCLGELVQIDVSHHDWFEGRTPKCCLLVFMDDATGRLMHLRFCDSENAVDYMMATRQ